MPETSGYMVHRFRERLSAWGHLDLGFLYRNISPAFQSLYSGSFTENNVPANEQGLIPDYR
jgi:hypothetical protein